MPIPYFYNIEPDASQKARMHNFFIQDFLKTKKAYDKLISSIH